MEFVQSEYHTAHKYIQDPAMYYIHVCNNNYIENFYIAACSLAKYTATIGNGTSAETVCFIVYGGGGENVQRRERM